MMIVMMNGKLQVQKPAALVSFPSHRFPVVRTSSEDDRTWESKNDDPIVCSLMRQM